MIASIYITIDEEGSPYTFTLEIARQNATFLFSTFSRNQRGAFEEFCKMLLISAWDNWTVICFDRKAAIILFANIWKCRMPKYKGLLAHECREAPYLYFGLRWYPYYLSFWTKPLSVAWTVRRRFWLMDGICLKKESPFGKSFHIICRRRKVGKCYTPNSLKLESYAFPEGWGLACRLSNSKAGRFGWSAWTGAL